MKLRVFNSLSKKKEIFKPINSGEVGMYTCGPTVYDYAHLGNFRTFIFEDLLKRWLIHLGYSVKHIMNITDIDDKTIKKAQTHGVKLETITDYYTSEFMRDLKWLKIIPADSFPRATKHIKEIIKLIQVLIKKNHAYVENDGSVYFKINSFRDYGRLTGLNIKNQQNNHRTHKDEYEKNLASDFALWKSWKKGDGDTMWNAPWGSGRPGWHIECSAMSTSALGDHFDIHCGGVDNLFPHHENEIAQSVCATGRPFVNFWMHSEHLLFDSEKMSKTSGNYYKIQELKMKKFTPESLRYLLLSGHYRTKISFSIDKKHESDKVIEKVSNFYMKLLESSKNLKSTNLLPGVYSSFRDAMNDDLNTPQALGIFFKWMKLFSAQLENKSIKSSEIASALNFFNIFNSIFSFKVDSAMNVPESVRELLIARNEARINKDWSLSDRIRNQIKNEGWTVVDTKDGQKLKKHH